MSSDAIVAARTFLPTWVVWAPLGTLVLQALLCAVMAATAVAVLSRPLRRLPTDAHWTERARLVWPVRRAITLSCLLSLVAAGPLEAGGALSRPGPVGRWTIGPILSIVTALVIAYVFENRLVRRLPWRTRWRGAAGYAVLVYPAYWVSGAFALWATHSRLSVGWSLAAGLIVVALAVGAAPWLGRLVRLVRRAPPRAEEVLSRTLQRLGGAGARLLVFPIPSANAFAFQLTRTVGVTQGALDVLDDEELGAILAHELGHLREPPAVILLRTVVSALVPVSLVVLPWVLALTSEWGWVALWAFALTVVILYRRLQRALERRADSIGQGASPAYAAALEKLYRTNLAPAVLRRPGAHPDLVDRMISAGVTPAWSRPQPPPSFIATLVLLLALAAVFFASSWRVRSLTQRDDGDSWRDLALGVAVDGRPEYVGRLGYWYLQRREYDAALALFRAAEAMNEADATWPALVATVLAYQGRCEEAGEASLRASSRESSSPYTEAAVGFVAACADLRSENAAKSSR